MRSQETEKVTIEIQDQLLGRAKAEASRRGVTLGALVEEGLRGLLESGTTVDYVLPDHTVGDPSGANPLERLSWNGLRREIYG